MGFSVSSLTNYVNEQSKELLVAAQFESETAGYANIQSGIKSSEALQILTNTPVPQDGTECGFNASGNTAFTQRLLATSPIKYQDSLCLRTLETKWTQILLKKGQTYTEADLPKAILDDIVNQINRINETADWSGDTTAASAFLNRYDGLRKIIKAASNEVIASASTWNASNARAIVQNVLSLIPAALMGNSNVVLFMGYDMVETYRVALMNANLYHVAVGSGTQQGILAEGSVHKIIPLHGLDGTNEIYAMDPNNLYLGVDMENEEEKADLWYSQDDDLVKYSFRFRRGWQVAFPSEIVRYQNT